LHANVTSADAAGIPHASDAADGANAADAADGANADDADVVVYNNDDADFDVASFQGKAAAAAAAAASAEENDDTGRLHWGKKWVAAAATAEKGENVI
jgi:hypothetical protein